MPWLQQRPEAEVAGKTVRNEVWGSRALPQATSRQRPHCPFPGTKRASPRSPHSEGGPRGSYGWDLLSCVVERSGDWDRQHELDWETGKAWGTRG